jgi:hypothetical protein
MIALRASETCPPAPTAPRRPRALCSPVARRRMDPLHFRTGNSAPAPVLEREHTTYAELHNGKDRPKQDARSPLDERIDACRRARRSTKQRPAASCASRCSSALRCTAPASARRRAHTTWCRCPDAAQPWPTCPHAARRCTACRSRSCQRRSSRGRRSSWSRPLPRRGRSSRARRAAW